MKRTLIITALAASCLASATSVSAITYEEELAQLTERFKKSDTNGDGKLTQKEAKAGGMTRLARFFSMMDSDSDGFVTFEQLKARLDERHK